LIRVRKPAVKPLALVLGAVRTRRSLVHVRFDSPELVAAIEATDADVFVAEHSYMAESFMRSSKFRARRLVVNTHVPEALVWRATRGLLGMVEAKRLTRDELRVALAANSVATFDADEAEFYRRNGVADHLPSTGTHGNPRLGTESGGVPQRGALVAAYRRRYRARRTMRDRSQEDGIP
jgi:hypothetical protein